MPCSQAREQALTCSRKEGFGSLGATCSPKKKQKKKDVGLKLNPRQSKDVEHVTDWRGEAAPFTRGTDRVINYDYCELALLGENGKDC